MYRRYNKAIWSRNSSFNWREVFPLLLASGHPYCKAMCLNLHCPLSILQLYTEL